MKKNISPTLSIADRHWLLQEIEDWLGDGGEGESGGGQRSANRK
ncbi:MAG: hypothetical protein QNJ54_03495 [Prochloraceae cyanobacterium]|nr:hypothetical protein [Prochloraceae cyanobacterium]